MTLLSVQNISKRFHGSNTNAVANVSFDIDSGATLGIVGASGSGKSTTARCVAGLIRPDQGKILLGDEDVRQASFGRMRELRRDMQVVFQDPFTSLNPRMRVEELVGEGLLVHRIEPDAKRRRDRVVETLELVGLESEHLQRYPRSFSGGQRQRIAIARAIAVNPRLLICDEPVSSLDVSVQAQVLNLLRDLHEQLGLSIMFIAHDLAVVRYLCERVVVMKSGEIVESGSRDEIYENAQHPYTQKLLAAVPVPDPRVERRRYLNNIERKD